MSLRIGQHQPSATYTLTAKNPSCLFSDSSMHLEGTIEITYETKWDTKTSVWYWQITDLKASPLMLMLINNQLPSRLTSDDIDALNMYTKIKDTANPDALNKISTETRHLTEIIKAFHTRGRLDLLVSIAKISNPTAQKGVEGIYNTKEVKDIKDIYRALAGTNIERYEQLRAFKEIVQEMPPFARAHISDIHNPEGFFCGSKTDRRRTKATLSIIVLMSMHIILEFFSRKYKDLPDPIRVIGNIILLALDSVCIWFFYKHHLDLQFNQFATEQTNKFKKPTREPYISHSNIPASLSGLFSEKRQASQPHGANDLLLDNAHSHDLYEL